MGWRHKIGAVVGAALLVGALMAAVPPAAAQEPTCEGTMFGDPEHTEGGLHTLHGTPGEGLVSGTVHSVDEELEPLSPLNTVVHEVNCGLVVPVECVVDDILGSDTNNCEPSDVQAGGADLGITKTGSNENPFVSDQLTFFLEIRNHGPDETAGVTVVDDLPGGVRFDDADPSQGDCDYDDEDHVVTCDLGFLGTAEENDSATVDILVTVEQSGQMTNVARVSGDQPDPNPGNNEDSFTFTAEHPLFACGDTVSGRVVFHRDLDCEEHGLFIGAAGTEIDLNGHFLRGQRNGIGISLAPGVQADDVHVTGGLIRNFTNGVVFSSGLSATLSHLSLVGNAERGASIVADTVVLDNVSAIANGDDENGDGPGEGLFIRSFGALGGGQIHMTDSLLRSNKGSGAVLAAGDRIIVRNSEARNSGGDGLAMDGDRVVVRDTVARFNGGRGLAVRANSVGLVSNRVVHSGRAGIRSTADRARINDNVARFNHRLGIASVDGPNVRGSNVCSDNNQGRPRQGRPDRLCR